MTLASGLLYGFHPRDDKVNSPEEEEEQKQCAHSSDVVTCARRSMCLMAGSGLHGVPGTGGVGRRDAFEVGPTAQRGTVQCV